MTNAKAQIVKRFESSSEATRWARQFDYAREYNALPKLEVRYIDGWVVINPHPTAIPQHRYRETWPEWMRIISKTYRR